MYNNKEITENILNDKLPYELRRFYTKFINKYICCVCEEQVTIENSYNHKCVVIQIEFEAIKREDSEKYMLINFDFDKINKNLIITILKYLDRFSFNHFYSASKKCSKIAKIAIQSDYELKYKFKFKHILPLDFEYLGWEKRFIIRNNFEKSALLLELMQRNLENGKYSQWFKYRSFKDLEYYFFVVGQ